MKMKILVIIFIIMSTSCNVESRLHDESVVGQSPNNSCHADRNETWTVGLIYCDEGMQKGYTLFSPMASTKSYLIDEFGREVHNWTSPGNHRPGLSAYLLDDGSLLRTANLGPNQPGEFNGGGSAGKIERISWEGDLEWSWTYSSELYRSHHDIEPLPNGNILMIAWEYRSETEAVEAGKFPQDDTNRALGATSVWPDRIIEVKPVGNADAEIVWQWSFWDHLIQDYDETKDNYGVVGEHPELLDVNFIDAVGSASGGRDWLHCNGIDYNQALDQIAISCKNTNEIYIIDHSTTTAEAAGHSGGNSGMGGDILYRYGNPESYRRGNSTDQVLFAQHDVQWIEEGYLDAGKLMIFNNGNGREPLYSSVDVIEPPINGSSYSIDETKPFGPENLSWTWDIGTEMYASAISGSTRLANGNTLITFGMQGTLIEVDYTGKVVWKYISPVNNLGIMSQGDSIFTGNGNKVFKVSRHDPMEPALRERDLTPRNYIEQWTDNCPGVESIPFDKDGDGCIDDSDNDGILDPDDICRGFNDEIDVDNDDIPDDCDDIIDSDNDKVSDVLDVCPGYDDSIDVDNDSIPDGCDLLIDSDNDLVADINDLCGGYDDLIDLDNDTVPDGCDDIIDSDFDDIDDDNDACPDTKLSNNETVDINGCSSAQRDTDGDNVTDLLDKCMGFNDAKDTNNNGIPDDCESESEEETYIGEDRKANSNLLPIKNTVIALAGVVILLLCLRLKSSDNS